jgi:hypothetical protein
MTTKDSLVNGASGKIVSGVAGFQPARLERMHALGSLNFHELNSMCAFARGHARALPFRTKQNEGRDAAAAPELELRLFPGAARGVAASRDRLAPAPVQEVFHSRVRVAGGVRGFCSRRTTRCVFPRI